MKLIMATFSYRLVNVFTRGAEVLSGNPLCVFENGTAIEQRQRARADLHAIL
jgi:predicted PhzF superfamily epimerase YddE/YHI9